jgi:outer membrane protein assembly factor BamD (BamD/ComL family)
MKGALAAYKTLVKDYPQSEYYAGSRKRIAYIERFFVNIN